MIIKKWEPNTTFTHNILVLYYRCILFGKPITISIPLWVKKLTDDQKFIYEINEICRQLDGV